MGVARYVVDAVVLEGRSVREVARSHGVSKSWVAELVIRYRRGGDDAIEPRSWVPHRIANKTPGEIEDRIVAMRQQLAEDGLDPARGRSTYLNRLDLLKRSVQA